MCKKIKVLAFIFIFTVLGVFSMIYFNIGIPCVYYELSGLYCAGCGMTRATISLLKLDIYQAIRYNAFSIIVILLIGIYIVDEIRGWLFNKPNFMDKKIPYIVLIIFIVILLLYGILRNIPQFSYLAPTML